MLWDRETNITVPIVDMDACVKINDMFVSLQGESRFVGHVCTFIRFQGCTNLCTYCFGVKSGRRIPKLITSIGPNKQLTEGEIGDKLMTFDGVDNMQLVETTITDKVIRKVNKWYMLKIEGTEYFVTPEHPFFTTRGEVVTSDLQIGDMLYHSSPNEKLSFRMKGSRNPMQNSVTMEKKVASTNWKKQGEITSRIVALKKKLGIYKSSWELMDKKAKKEHSEKSSASKKGDKNPNWKGGSNSPNYDRLKQLVRDDVICTCAVCEKETFDLEVHHRNGNRSNDFEDNLIVLCKSCHSSVHKQGYNFWQGDRKDGKVLSANEHRKHIHNGFCVEDIKYYDRANFPFSIRPKPLEVYNYTCAPYPSYLLDYMWVHNCDTPDAQDLHSGIPLSVFEVIDYIKRKQISLVEFTGGEPLLQMDALLSCIFYLLRDTEYDILVETNGNEYIKPLIGPNPKLHIIMDIKTPSSGEHPKLCIENLALLNPWDEVKMICSDAKDIAYAKEMLNNYNLPNPTIHPVWDGDIGYTQEIARIIIEEKLPVRLGIQLHKLLNIA